MAKRMVDSKIFESRTLKNTKEALYKLFWLFLITNCDPCGIWKVDLDYAGFLCGGEIDVKKVAFYFGEKIFVLENGKTWFVSTFLKNQGLNLESKERKTSKIRENLIFFGIFNGQILDFSNLTSLRQAISNDIKGPSKDLQRTFKGPSKDLYRPIQQDILENIKKIKGKNEKKDAITSSFIYNSSIDINNIDIYTSKDINILVNYWIMDKKRGALNKKNRSELKSLVDVYGFQQIKKAVDNWASYQHGTKKRRYVLADRFNRFFENITIFMDNEKMAERIDMESKALPQKGLDRQNELQEKLKNGDEIF